MSKLYNLLEDFLAQEVFQQQAPLKAKLLTDVLAKRQTFEWYEKKSVQLIETLTQTPQPDTDHFFLLTAVHQSLFFHPYKDNTTVAGPTFDAILNNLEKAYWLTKLRLMTDQIIRRNIYTDFSEDVDINQITKAITAQPEPVFNMYLKLLQLWSQTNQLDLFVEIYKDLSQKLHFFNDLDKAIFSNILLIYANYQYELGYTIYITHMMNIYRLQDKEKFMVYKNGIDPLRFLNTVRVSASVREFEWAADFIKCYQRYLNPDYRGDVVALAQASWHFYKEDNHMALAYIKEVKEGQFMIKLQSEILAIRVFLNIILENPSYYEPLESRVNNFKKFIQRDKIFGSNKKAALRNFASAVSKITRYVHDPNQNGAALPKLKQEIQEMTPLLGRKWILEFIDKLMQE